MRPKPPPDPHCLIVNGGALGDTIAAIPAIRYGVKHLFDLNNLQVMIPSYLRELFDFLPEKNVFYFGVGKNLEGTNWIPIKQYDNIPPGMHISAVLSPMHMSLIDYGAMKFLGKTIPIDEQDYPQVKMDPSLIAKFKLPKQYACILVTNLNVNRSVPFDEAYRIAKYFLRQGITPVFVGKTTTMIDSMYQQEKKSVSPPPRRGIISLVDKTTITEAAQVLGGACVVVGADTGLIHLAACTDVPIVCSYTTVRPELRMPVRHGVLGWNMTPIEPESECKYCASDWWNYMNFNECYQGDFQCVKSAVNYDRIIPAVETILNKGESNAQDTSASRGGFLSRMFTLKRSPSV